MEPKYTKAHYGAPNGYTDESRSVWQVKRGVRYGNHRKMAAKSRKANTRRAKRIEAAEHFKNQLD